MYVIKLTYIIQAPTVRACCPNNEPRPSGRGLLCFWAIIHGWHRQAQLDDGENPNRFLLGNTPVRKGTQRAATARARCPNKQTTYLSFGPTSIRSLALKGPTITAQGNALGSQSSPPHLQALKGRTKTVWATRPYGRGLLKSVLEVTFSFKPVFG